MLLSTLIQLYNLNTRQVAVLLSHSLFPFLFPSSSLKVKSYFSLCWLVIIEEVSPTFIVVVNRT